MQYLIDRWLNALKFGTLFLLAAAVVFSALERGFSIRRLKKPWRSTLLDLQYFFTGLFYPPVVSFGIAGVFAYFSIKRQIPTVRASPAVFAAEFLAVLFACDMLAYIRHRLFHSRQLWAFHSIHHSSEDVNWTSGPRLHAIETLCDITGETLVFMLAAVAGTEPRVLFCAGIVIGLWNFFIHSNTRWTFGPLRYVLVSPVQHHWHHSDSREAMDKNFAVMFSCIDVLLGTFYMPKNTFPKTTGLMGEERKNHPRTFMGQLLYPIKRG